MLCSVMAVIIWCTSTYGVSAYHLLPIARKFVSLIPAYDMIYLI
jgi:hypothetical protein